MFKKGIGIGLLVCVVFFAALVFIPVDIEPTVQQYFKLKPTEMRDKLADLELFTKWDPKGTTDSTVTYKLNAIGDELTVIDTALNILGSYKVVESSDKKVSLRVNLKSGQELNYDFIIEPNGSGTDLTWQLFFEGNLMMAMFDAESQLEDTFSKGLKQFEQVLEYNK